MKRRPGRGARKRKRSRTHRRFVGDVARAIIAGLSLQDGRTYELGGPTVYSFKELLRLILSEIGRKRVLVPLPFGIASLKAMFLQILPNPILTMDQVRLLKHDNVVSATAPGLGELGITPTSVEAVIPSYLWRYRAKGEYAPLASPEEATAYPYTPIDRERIARQRTRLIIGGVERVKERLESLIESTRADELMVTSMVYDHGARKRSYELLARAFALPVRA